MGQGTNGVDPRQQTQHLAREIEVIRGDLDVVVGELDRRRHELLDWRLQMRRHAVGITVTLTSVIVLVGGLVWWRLRRHREEQRPLSKLRRLRKAVARMIDNPDDVARPTPSPGRKIFASAGSAVAGALGKRVARGR